MNFKFLLNRICRTVSVMDLRSDEDTRKARCEKFARKHKTCGKAATFDIGEACNVSRIDTYNKALDAKQFYTGMELAA